MSTGSSNFAKLRAVQGATTSAKPASITAPAFHDRCFHASGSSKSGTSSSASPRLSAPSPTANPSHAASAAERVRRNRSASHSAAAVNAAYRLSASSVPSATHRNG